MSALKNMPISFPGLFGDWELNIDPVAIHIGHGIYWYGIILAFAMLAGLYLCMKQAKHYGLTEDNIMDMVLWAVPCCIIGARFYYVLFYLDLYRNTDGSLDWGAMFRIWDGGLAIYGGVIGAVLTLLIFTKVRKQSFFSMADSGVLGLITGQIIGRWGNFFNCEAFGGYTDNLFAMRIKESIVNPSMISAGLLEHEIVENGVKYIQVHPTFLYESCWNLCVLAFMLWYRKRKKFDGEMLWVYFLGYGLGRVWIEGLRTDQLKLPGTGLAVSQLLSAALVGAAVGVLHYKHSKLKKQKNI